MDTNFFKDALDKGIPNENTRKNYKYRLNGLERKLEEHYKNQLGKDAPKHLVMHVLTHPRMYYPLLQEIYTEMLTMKNMLTLVLALFKYAELKCRLESPYKKWKQYHDEYADKEYERYSKNQPTERQKESYVSFDDIRRVVADLGAKKPHQQGLKLSLQFCLLNMYLNIMPKRADFGAIKVYYNVDPQRGDINYIVLGKESYFVLNHYNKTGKGADVIVESVPKELARVFVESLKAWPRRYLFVGMDEEPFKTANAYTKFVIATFEKHLGKKTGVSMLRHIYINERVDLNKLSIEEKDTIASAMGHSRKLQEQYKLIF